METIVAVLYLVTIGSVGLFAMFLYVLRPWTATPTSYLLVLSPLFTVALASVLAGAQITLQLLLGGALVGVGVYVGALSAPSGALSSALSPKRRSTAGRIP